MHFGQAARGFSEVQKQLVPGPAHVHTWVRDGRWKQLGGCGAKIGPVRPHELVGHQTLFPKPWRGKFDLTFVEVVLRF